MNSEQQKEEQHFVCFAYGSNMLIKKLRVRCRNAVKIGVCKIKKHNLHYSIKKIGSEFNSSGNPYIQKDIIEQYFSDKIRLLDNKMYISLKLKKIQNGILDGSSSFNTDKYDMNINYYPGINLPSLSFSLGTHYRKGGEGSRTWNEFLEQCDNNDDNVIDIFDLNDCYNDWIIYDIDLSIFPYSAKPSFNQRGT